MNYGTTMRTAKQEWRAVCRAQVEKMFPGGVGTATDAAERGVAMRLCFYPTVWVRFRGAWHVRRLRKSEAGYYVWWAFGQAGILRPDGTVNESPFDRWLPRAGCQMLQVDMLVASENLMETL